MSRKHHQRSSSSSSSDDYEVVRDEDHGHEEKTIYEQHHRRPQVSCGSQAQDSFCVPLSFDQELAFNDAGVLVPLSTLASNNDNVRGVLKLKFNSNLSKAAYALYVYNATAANNRITGAHLHFGSANRNGPVVVNLFDGPARNANGLLIKGRFDNRDIVADGSTNSVASIYQAIRDGLLYANVHSEQFPDGIVRGQIYLKNAYTPSQ